MSTRILTVGHSTRSLEEFTALLTANEVTLLVDIRSIPGSRRNPQFNVGSLPAALASMGIGYRLIPGLGGRRRARPDSPNKGWRNLSFRAYADHMQTAEFAAGLQELIALASQANAAIMCAEALPWRCHRWLVSDALVVHGVTVEHIMGRGLPRPHQLTEWARFEDGRLWYPGPDKGAAG